MPLLEWSGLVFAQGPELQDRKPSKLETKNGSVIATPKTLKTAKKRSFSKSLETEKTNNSIFQCSCENA